MNPQLILARATGYNCAVLFVNQVVVAEANSTAEIDRLVNKAAHQLSVALGVPLLECEVEVPADMDGTWVWADLLDKLPPGSGADCPAALRHLQLERRWCASGYRRRPRRRLG